MGGAVGVRIHLTAVITVAFGVLQGGEYIEMVGTAARPQVERRLASVDVVVHLLGHHGLMGLQGKIVATPAVLVRAVIFQRQACIIGRTHERARTQGLGFKLCYLGETVAVVVVTVAHAVLPVDKKPQTVVAVHHRCIHCGVVVELACYPYRSEAVGSFGIVHHRVAGDDIDCAADGRGTEQGRTATAHHLHAVNHVSRNLLKSVDTGKSREHRARIHQNLRVVSVETVDAHLGETAVLAIVLHAHTGLKAQTVGKRTGAHLLEQLGRGDTHKRRTVAAFLFALARSNHHLVEHESVRRKVKIHLYGTVAFGIHLVSY